jgi:hypothetical protein
MRIGSAKEKLSFILFSVPRLTANSYPIRKTAQLAKLITSKVSRGVKAKPTAAGRGRIFLTKTRAYPK